MDTDWEKAKCFCCASTKQYTVSSLIQSSPLFVFIRVYLCPSVVKIIPNGMDSAKYCSVCK